MRTSEILKKLDQAWSEKLNTQMNWGTKQLRVMWRETLTEVMFEYIDVE